MVVSKAIVTFSYQNEKKKDWNTTFAVFECGLIFPSVSPNSGVSYGRENGGQTLPRWQRRGAGEECTARSCSQFVERYDGFHGISPDRLSHWISLVVVDCLKWLNVGPTVQYSTVFFSFFLWWLATGHECLQQHSSGPEEMSVSRTAQHDRSLQHNESEPWRRHSKETMRL